MMMAIRAHSRPVIELSGSMSSPVMPCRVTTGMPSEPNATGAVLATRQMNAA